MAESRRYDFLLALAQHQLNLTPVGIETLQVNLTKLCNQACQHCHVDASPKRTEMMARPTLEKCLEILAAHPEIKNLDITGGAPELHPDFNELVASAHRLHKQVMVRHNLTVTFDGNPQTGEQKNYLPEFFAAHHIEVISSLPYYQEFFTDKQRGRGVFSKSIAAMRLLNAQGYGRTETGLRLNLVYNPVGAFLPASQAGLEADFKRELAAKFGVLFNQLYTITNMPIHRFKAQLQRLGSYETYMDKLCAAFNPIAAQGVMCRSLLSVGYDGKIYDCDFNQMLEMQIYHGQPMTVFDLDWAYLQHRSIRFDSHCYGCTAGAGSSCGGTTT